MKENLSPTARRMTLRQLRAYTAVARAGTISAAAEGLGLTPPAVALQVKQLEELLGVALLERTSEGARPTDAGREVLAASSRVEEALASCIESVAALRGMSSGRVAVGVISTAKYFAPSALAAFQRTHPRVEMRLLIGNRLEMIAALENYELDLAIMGRPPQHFPVDQTVIGDHPHVVVAAPDHPLVGRRMLPPAVLAEETFLLREPGSGTRTLAQGLFAEFGLEPRIGMEIGSNETIKQAVIAGMGLAFISAHTVAAEIHDRRLAILEIQGLPIMRQWFVVKRQEKRLLPAAQAMWEHLATSGNRFLPDVRWSADP
jgi:LysR family transcriptional regulator for metE and metH